MLIGGLVVGGGGGKLNPVPLTLTTSGPAEVQRPVTRIQLAGVLGLINW